MAINFEPAAPLVGFDIAQQYGALQQQEKNRAFDLQRSQAQGNLDNQAMNRVQQSYEFDATQQAQQDAQEAQQAHQVQMQAEGARLQGELQSQRLTQIEQQRMTQMQNAIGAVNAHPDLDDAAKADLVTQIQTGLSPLQQRFQRQQAEDRQRQMEDQHQIAAAQASIMKENERNAADPTTNIREIRHPTTGESMGIWQRGHNGTWEPMLDADGMPIGRGGRGAGGGRGGADGGLNDDAYLRHVEHLQSEATAIEQHARDSANDDAKKNPFGTVTEEGRPARRRTREEWIGDQLAARGLPRDLNEQRAARAPLSRPRPIPVGTPPEEMDQAQRTALRQIDTMRNLIRGEGAPQAEVEDLQRMEDLWRRYGDENAIPYERRAWMRQRLAELEVSQRRRQAARAARPAAAGPSGAPQTRSPLDFGGDWQRAAEWEAAHPGQWHPPGPYSPDWDRNR